MKKRLIAFLGFISLFICCEAQVMQQFNGVYQTGDNKVISIAPFGTTQVLVLPGGQVAGLKASGNEFVIGKTLGNTNETTGKISFAGKDENTTLFLKYDDGRELSAEKLKLTARPIEFKNGKQKLSGELILPEGKGPFPVIVQTHGSGEETREAGRGMAYFFASNGIASFIFDKRGCGQSSGKEWRASFKDYAQDLLAAVESLSNITEIDQKEIGLYGHSQGGWVAPLAVYLQPGKIAFCIISAANAQTPVEENLYAGDEEIRLRGYDEQTIAEMHEFRKIKYEVGILGKKLDDYKSTILPEAEKKSWFKLTGGGLPDNIFWKENGYYDAAPALQSLKCPVLAIYAGYDISTDSKTQLGLMKKLLPPGKISYAVFEDANHMMMKVSEKNSTAAQLPLITQFADGYLDQLIVWIKKTLTETGR